ncbi:MAG TPA: glucosaminidase domain-containing protein [Bacteroidia bacterium]|nr:glucosaminidase domain-containing protein [Bacteroidia bacterium]
MKRQIVLVFVLLFSSVLAFAQPAEKKNTPQDYIDLYKDDAIREMQLFKVPASITLAQGMLESDNGNSALAVYANNHFGIKCHKEWTGETYTQDDDTKDECFRKYGTVYDSYVDHSEFLKSRPRYASLFELKLTDYKGWAKGLKSAGYATDPKYADRLIDIIERYKLHEFDKLEGLPPVAAEPRKTEGNKTVSTNVSRREIYFNNNIKYVIVKPGDTFMKIAQELDMGVWQLYKYNDMNKNTVLKPGQILYIQPKRRKAEPDKHQMKPGETMHDVSQKYGIKLKKLYKYNEMEQGTEPKAGQVIYLRKRKPVRK